MKFSISAGVLTPTAGPVRPIAKLFREGEVKENSVVLLKAVARVWTSHAAVRNSEKKGKRISHGALGKIG